MEELFQTLLDLSNVSDYNKAMLLNYCKAVQVAGPESLTEEQGMEILTQLSPVQYRAFVNKKNDHLKKHLRRQTREDVENFIYSNSDIYRILDVSENFKFLLKKITKNISYLVETPFSENQMIKSETFYAAMVIETNPERNDSDTEFLNKYSGLPYIDFTNSYTMINQLKKL